LALRLKGSVAMRSAVVKQMKKPIEKRITRPILEPIDILRRRMTGMGRMKIAISVARLRAALVQLKRMLAYSSRVTLLDEVILSLTDARKS
jgi:hypothetical protein